jgi:hypothetical protein
MAQLAAAYWGERGKSGTVPAASPRTAPGDVIAAAPPTGGSLAPDLVVTSLDNRAIWAAWNATGGAIQRAPLNGSAEE